jgi:hypothetical protein
MPKVGTRSVINSLIHIFDLYSSSLPILALCTFFPITFLVLKFCVLFRSIAVMAVEHIWLIIIQDMCLLVISLNVYVSTYCIGSWVSGLAGPRGPCYSDKDTCVWKNAPCQTLSPLNSLCGNSQ